MGMEDRDWYREEKRRDHPRPLAGAVVVVAVIVGLVAAGGAVKLIRGKQPTFEGEKRELQRETKLSLIRGTPSATFGRNSLYWPNDKWKAYLAPEQDCPGGERTDLPLAEQ